MSDLKKKANSRVESPYTVLDPPILLKKKCVFINILSNKNRSRSIFGYSDTFWNYN